MPGAGVPWHQAAADGVCWGDLRSVLKRADCQGCGIERIAPLQAASGSC